MSRIARYRLLVRNPGDRIQADSSRFEMFSALKSFESAGHKLLAWYVAPKAKNKILYPKRNYVNKDYKTKIMFSNTRRTPVRAH
jgi:hypothetical protein